MIVNSNNTSDCSAASPLHAMVASVSPTDEALSVVASEQHITFELLDDLQRRLEKVLGEEPKDSGAAIRPLGAQATPLLQMIDGRRESAAAINARLRWIMDRIVL